jgi:hypothetical protein
MDAMIELDGLPSGALTRSNESPAHEEEDDESEQACQDGAFPQARRSRLGSFTVVHVCHCSTPSVEINA